MLKVSILFGKPTDEEAFERHFQQVHAPLGAGVPGISRIELGRLDVVSSTEPTLPRYHRMVDLYFTDGDRLREAVASGQCEAAIEDLSAFATGGVTFMISQVEEIPVVPMVPA